MLAVYFDESGTHKGSDCVTVAGYIGDSQSWKRYDAEWQAALKAYGLPYFHMTEFVGRGKKDRWGEHKRRYRFAKLQGITRRAALAGIGVMLDVSAWKRHVVTPKDQRYFGTSVLRPLRHCCAWHGG